MGVVETAGGGELGDVIDRTCLGGTTVSTDEWNGYDLVGRSTPTATGCAEVHGNTQEGLWTGVRNSLRPFRGVGKWYEDQYLVAIRFRLERVRRIGGAVEVEVVFGINRLPRERADAAEWLRLTRVHWGIEIRLHGRRDGALARTPAGCGRGRRRG